MFLEIALMPILRNVGAAQLRVLLSKFIPNIVLQLALLFVIHSVAGATSTYAIHQESQGYLKLLIDQAIENELHDTRYWHILLHYNRSLFGITSEIDDPSFFLSTAGKHDPKSELVATLESFFEDSIADHEHPRCRFVARYDWLRSELAIDEGRLPQVICSQYESVMAQLLPQKAVLVFPSAYMNNPASMFGHTLLNIKGKDESSLLSNSVNYSARTPVENGLLFAFKGVLGFYKGYYEIFPYYARIQLYSDINQRDIWEYELSLNPVEIRRMVNHLWELREVYSKYYFFDENCSYNLLRLLEVASPSSSLSQGFRGYVIPLDTIRAVDEAGLIEAIHYRPSKATKMRRLMDSIPRDLRRLALRIGKLQTKADTIFTNELSEEHKRYLLDLATEFLQYRYIKKEIGQDLYQKSFLEILRERSQISGPAEGADTVPRPPSPETGHRTQRLRLGIGFEDDTFYTHLGFRAAYHDLMDPDVGYPEGSQIEFLNTNLRYDPADEKLELGRLDIINIAALSPRNLFFKPVSWKFQTGVSKIRLRDDKKHHVFFLSAGQGLTWRLKKNARVYTILETELIAGRNLNPAYALGIGGTIGILANMNKRWKAHLFGRALTFEVGDRHDVVTFNLEQLFKITTNMALNFTITRQRSFDLYDTFTLLGTNFYF